MQSSPQKRNSLPKRGHGVCGESSPYRIEHETSYFLSLMDSHRETTILTKGSRRMAFCHGNRSLLSIFRKLNKLFISHEDEIDNIYLFLRKNKKDPYGYLGRLGYITHDPTRENPVWFQWQLLDWDDIPADQQHYYGDFAAKSEQASSPAVSHDIPSDLRFVTPPAKKHKLVTNEHSFRTIKNADYAKRDAGSTNWDYQ